MPQQARQRAAEDYPIAKLSGGKGWEVVVTARRSAKTDIGDAAAYLPMTRNPEHFDGPRTGLSA